MKQIWLLTKIQLRSAFDFVMITSNKNRERKSKGYTFLVSFLLIICIISAASFSYSYAIGMILNTIGMLKLLPEMMMAVTCVITIITTINKVKGTLFGFKDYDLVMSLPVRTSKVVASRLILLYIINITFTLIIMIPAAIAYGMLAKASLYFYVTSLVTVIFIPVIPMITASFLGTVITVIASKFRHSNLINLIFTFALLTGIMGVSLFTGDSEEKLGQMSAVLIKQVDGIYPLAGMYRKAVCELDVISLMIFLFVSILFFILFATLVGYKFKAINTCLIATKTSADYKIGRLEQASPFKALYRKELRRFFSSSLYIMNTAFGVVMMTIGAVATIFLSPETLANIMEVPETAGFIGTLAPVLVSVCITMTFITACSISLEGKNLWILKISPVLAKTIFQSKIAVSLTITLPAIILDGILLTVGLKLSFAESVLLIVMPAAYAFFTAISGLIINLSLPNLNWTTEVSVIKQSAASMVATFGGMFAAAFPALLLYVFRDFSSVYVNAFSTLVIVIVTIILYHYLNTKGEKKFLEL